MKLVGNVFRISTLPIIELENQSILGKHSKHFETIKTSSKNDPFDKASMNNIHYFTPKYLKQTFGKSRIKFGPSNMPWYKCLKRIFNKNHIKSGPSNMILICSAC